MTLVLEEQPVKILKQYFQGKNRSIFQSIYANSTTRIVEMIEKNENRILTNKNRWVNSRTNFQYHGRNNNNISRISCPMKYTAVICSGCFDRINMHELYLTKNSRFRAKFYHVYCASQKNVI